jgi:hypothetical protein
MSDVSSEDGCWPAGWDGHELSQLRYWASLPLWVKLDWLEEAHRRILAGGDQAGFSILRLAERGQVPQLPVVEVQPKPKDRNK